MKTVARDVVQIHYKDEIHPTLDFGHNSSQLEKLVEENVDKLLRDSLFHVGLTRDENVTPF
jgi:hypothetical protein